MRDIAQRLALPSIVRPDEDHGRRRLQGDGRPSARRDLSKGEGKTHHRNATEEARRRRARPSPNALKMFSQ